MNAILRSAQERVELEAGASMQAIGSGDCRQEKRLVCSLLMLDVIMPCVRDTSRHYVCEKGPLHQIDYY
jgi:hypothetical protein